MELPTTELNSRPILPCADSIIIAREADINFKSVTKFLTLFVPMGKGLQICSPISNFTIQ